MASMNTFRLASLAILKINTYHQAAVIAFKKNIFCLRNNKGWLSLLACVSKNRQDLSYKCCSWKHSLIYKLSQHKLNSFVWFNDIISSVFYVQKVHIYYLKTNKQQNCYKNFKLKAILKHWAIILTYSYVLRKAAFIFF